jgi:NAD(P)H-nitrite reductase large subunit
METPEGKIICVCMSVSESEIITAMDGLGLVSVDGISRHTAAGTGCGKCKPAIQTVFEKHRSKTDLFTDPPF